MGLIFMYFNFGSANILNPVINKLLLSKQSEINFRNKNKIRTLILVRNNKS